MVALGEMAAHLLHMKGFVGYAIHSVDPAFGLALGCNYLMKHLIATANSANAVGAVINIGWDTCILYR
jgi:amino acid permease